MSAVSVDELEVGDLDAAGVLALARDNEREIREREVLRLELAYQWAVLHPAEPTSDVLDAEESLGGDGTPPVAAFTPEAFAVAVGMSPAAGSQLVGDVLDLRHRLPLTWKRTQALSIPAWRARRVAQQTHTLPLAGARWVDEQLAARTDGACGPVIVDRLVAHAIAEVDPEAHERREDGAQAGWDVLSPTPTRPTSPARATSPWTATPSPSPTSTTWSARSPTSCHLDGDSSPLGVRKITALRLITRAAQGHGTIETASTMAGRVKVYVRVDAADLDVDATGGSALATGEVERLGAATLTKIRDWVGHHQVVVTPVLNLRRRDAVDQHDPPPWMRELVVLRDGHCIFPRCTVDARSCDLDHEIPYDPDGPPGQTCPDNLAALCRRHHRAKTTRLWRYTRTPTGDYLWHGPHGATYLVTPRGTRRA